MKIAIEDIAVEVGRGVRALDGVSAEISDGEITAVIGPSGAGKTSLMNVLAGLLGPDRGRVVFDGVDVTRVSPEKRGMGIVFQDHRLFPFLSGRGNVAFAPRVAGLRAVERNARVDEALALVRAASFADRSVRVLSGGEKQRIAIARALAMRPRGLLLDEPFAALDAELRRGLRDELRDLIRRLGLTTILVTHDRDDAFALASKVIVLRAGKVEQIGSTSECYRRPASEFVATLLGEATILPVEKREGDRGLVAGAWIPLEGSGSCAVIRPEDLALASAGLTGTLRESRFVAGRWRAVVEIGGASVVAVLDRAPEGSTVTLGVTRAVATV